jgi:hypothetical protein
MSPLGDDSRPWDRLVQTESNQPTDPYAVSVKDEDEPLPVVLPASRMAVSVRPGRIW